MYTNAMVAKYLLIYHVKASLRYLEITYNKYADIEKNPLAKGEGIFHSFKIILIFEHFICHRTSPKNTCV